MLAPIRLAPTLTKLADCEGAVAVWDCAAKSQVCTVPRPDVKVALAPDGQSLATAVGVSGRCCELWGTAKGELLGQVQVGSGVMGVAYSPRGTFLLTTDHTQGVVWHIAQRTALEWQPPVGRVPGTICR